MGCGGKGGNGIEVRLKECGLATHQAYDIVTHHTDVDATSVLRCDVSTTSFKRDVPTVYLSLLAHKSFQPM